MRASLEYMQRLQLLFFTKESRSMEIDSIDGRNGNTFNYLAPSKSGDENTSSQRLTCPL